MKMTELLMIMGKPFSDRDFFSWDFSHQFSLSTRFYQEMSFDASDISDGEEDHAMDNIRAMLQDYYGTDNGDEVKEDDYYDMDSKVFDKDKYIPVLCSTAYLTH